MSTDLGRPTRRTSLSRAGRRSDELSREAVSAASHPLTGDSQVQARLSQEIRSMLSDDTTINNVNGGAGGGRILVVDDEPSIVDAVATALRYEGFDVREEASGRGVLPAVVGFQPHLIVLDWMLPDYDGVRVARRLRERGFDTAILFLTAKDA